jgi:hypothetical protein
VCHLLAGHGKLRLSTAIFHSSARQATANMTRDADKKKKKKKKKGKRGRPAPSLKMYANFTSLVSSSRFVNKNRPKSWKAKKTPKRLGLD